jgi:hypothetical protein
MTDIIIVEGPVEEGAGAHNVGQVTRPNGDLLVQADVTTWGVDAFERGSNTAIYTLAAQAPALVIFDTPQTDGYWGLDLVGYNFRHEVTQAALAAQSADLEGGKRYLFHYSFVTVVDGTIHARFIWQIQGGPAF